MNCVNSAINCSLFTQEVARHGLFCVTTQPLDFCSSPCMPKLHRPTPAELSQMSHAEKRALIEPWFDLLDGLEKRRADVEKRVVKTSRNSSRPPSSNGLKRPAAAPRQAGVKRPGGQLGHVGMTRAWHDSPDAARELRPAGFCGCGLPLADQWGVIQGNRTNSFS